MSIYHPEIYETPPEIISDSQGPIVLIDKCAEKAYDIGYQAGKEADKMEDYTNLTAAIKTGAKVDYDKLDGLEAICQYGEEYQLHFNLHRNETEAKDNFYGWTTPASPIASIISQAWSGDNGWTLNVKGDIPIRVTADELETGMVFEPVGAEILCIIIDTPTGKRAKGLGTEYDMPPESVDVRNKHGINQIMEQTNV